MKNCHKLEHDVTGWNYNTQHSGISCLGAQGERLLEFQATFVVNFPTLCITRYIHKHSESQDGRLNDVITSRKCVTL